jgi:Skp family chaperone for outer membrane proteins
MRSIRFVTGSFILLTLFAVSAFAQTTNLKIGVINPFVFQAESGGIAKYISALNTLDNEFKPDNQKLQTLAQDINKLKNEIQTLQNQKETVPVDDKTLAAKIEEHNKKVRELKFQEEDAKARFESRQTAVMAPIMQDIGKAMQEYADKNGYHLLLDASKMQQAGLILAFNEVMDVTEDFIKFYNARPAGTASRAQ